MSRRREMKRRARQRRVMHKERKANSIPAPTTQKLTGLRQQPKLQFVSGAALAAVASAGVRPHQPGARRP